MIAFTCPGCCMKLAVKPEFAGRSSRCPTCKQPLVVPLPSKPQADIAAGPIDGLESSLVKAGVEGGVTLPPAAAARAGRGSIQELLARRAKNAGRYLIEGEIARGGMGSVWRAVDCDIRREVAVKYLLDQADAGKKLRFIEEAQITGQLEHPSIVPIHELGVDQLQRLFFSMKMVNGRSLAQVLDELRARPGAAEKEWSLGRLLNVLINICNALAYAHSRGVVHRDLKPANIMIGDFGEVYVMDWGLAKVRKGTGFAAPDRVPLAQPAAAPVAVPVAASQSASARSVGKVATSREAEADLTQEGAVLGTPVYMPPEQATGRVEAIDQRSDLYSMGAILYELLTLQPPVDKEGGYLAILMRVMQGEIVPPEQRSPQQAQAGRIPRELSAVAMKALALRPQDRYQSVEALRRDIERFQEGRSVSAKEDSFREAVWKLVKRNQAVSLVAAVAGVLLAALWTHSSWTSYRERTARTEMLRKSVPAFVRAAQLFANQKAYDDALTQVNAALEYQQDDPPALFLKGKVLIAQKRFAAAKVELDRCRQLEPGNRAAAELAALCGKARAEDASSVAAFVDVFMRQNDPTFAESMVQSREQLLAIYRRRIDAAWPSLGNNLSMDKEGRCSLSFAETRYIEALTDLGPLKGISLVQLNLSGGKQLKDLTPLFGMQLTSLDLTNCGLIQDLSPLRGMPLAQLHLRNGYLVSDLSPLQGRPLTHLNLHNCYLVRNLTPLRGMPLTYLNLIACAVTDISPLQGMPLNALHLSYCDVRDLTPLRGMPLTYLSLMSGNRQATDLTPLQGMPLTEIVFTPKIITQGMEVLRGMKTLKAFSLNGTTKYPPDEFWRRYDAKEFK